LAIAAQNCCVVAGYLTSIGGQRNFTVINLSEGDGTEVWRQVIDTGDTGRANAVAAFLDGTGDFIAGGTLTAIRLAAEDGSEPRTTFEDCSGIFAVLRSAQAQHKHCRGRESHHDAVASSATPTSGQRYATDRPAVSAAAPESAIPRC
jgi:hypothetical protein